MKLGRNELCWCGSGKKFKRCHLDRAREEPIPLPALGNELGRFFKAKECLHPLASRTKCTTVISAHTIQRAGALAGIIDNTGHCLSFYPPDVGERIEPHRTGWRHASTFSGFCGKHDGPVFAPLETRPFVGSPEQCFLLAYRAECHELYQKQASERAHEPLRQRLDRGMAPSDQRLVQERQGWVGAGVRKGLAESLRHKRLMDSEFLEQRFDSYQRVFVCFEGSIAVASAGAPTPNRSINGDKLLVLHDPKVEIHRLYTGVVPRTGGGAVVLVWRADESAPGRFVESLLDVERGRLPGMLVQFMFAYISNTYFSVDWWQALNVEGKAHIRRLAQMGNPYYEQWPYEHVPMPWKITHVANEWPAG